MKKKSWNEEKWIKREEKILKKTSLKLHYYYGEVRKKYSGLRYKQRQNKLKWNILIYQT